MATIVTRAGKGSPLTNNEVDSNFSNLNNDKIELTDLSVGAEGAASGDGSIAYNNTSGVFTYTPPDLSGYLTSYTETDPVVGAITGIVKADGAGNISAAVAGTDYIATETYSSANDLLTAIKTVDGTGSGLDADLLDGNQATAFATAAQGSLADSAVQNLGDLGVTSTAAELNTLDGFTGTKDDLNYAKDLRATGVTSTEYDYLDGVTSNIQTQLDGKASTDLTNADITRHSIRPSLLLDFANSKQLDPRITFSRASTGTYYDGKTFAKAEENLVTYSQEFDNAAWSKGDATVTANDTTAPDGTTTADKLVENTNNSYHYVSKSISSSTSYVWSVYAKDAGDSRYLAFGGSGIGSANEAPIFDLVNGTVDVGSTTTIIKSASIQSVGNGWYRCSAYLVSPASSNMLTLGITNSSTDNSIVSYTGDGTSGFYIWGAQLEQRDSVTAYTPTTSQPITNYIPVLQTAAAGTARFDHDPVTGESKGLLIEEQRTNLALYSSDFSNWANSSTTCETNVAIAPDGTLTADKIYATTSNTNHFTFRSCTTAGTVYTWSAYVKTAGDAYCVIHAHNINVSAFQFSTGTFVTTASGVTTAVQNVGDGWYRISMTYTASSGNVYIGGSPSTGYTYAGDGYSGIYIWGAQVEAGSFPTSYIKTTSAQATRNADAASMTGTNFSSWYRQDEGTVYAEATGRAIDSTIFAFDDGTSANQIHVGFDANAIRTFCLANGSVESALSTSYDGSIVKVAATHSRNDVAFTTNGNTPSIDTSQIMPVITQAGIGRRVYAGAYTMTGTIKKIAYYPTRLTNQELVALTEE
jgi:hypothetical protein